MGEAYKQCGEWMFKAGEVEEKVEKIREYTLREASEAIKRVRSVITAFNTNIDALHFVKSEEIRDALSQCHKEALTEKMKKPPNRIVQAEDFLTGLLLSMKNGRGIEWVIENRDVFNWIHENFAVNEYRMGGQAGITANMLACLKVRTIYPHVASLPELQAKLFVDSDRIKIPVEVDGGLKFESPLRAVRQNDEPLIHWIFEYNSGVKAEWDGTIVAPCTNRFIATWDEKNTKLYIDEAFVQGMKKVIEDVDLAIVSGYHMMRRGRYFTKEDYSKKIAFTRDLLNEWKAVSNVKVHLELAYFTDLDILNTTLMYLSEVVNGIGLNEDELAQCVNCLGKKSLCRRIQEDPTAENLLEGLLYLCRRFNLKKIVVHTRDFCIAIAKKPVDKDLKTAIALGNCVAAARAVTGNFCDLNKIIETLKEGATHLSKKGLENLYTLVKVLEQKSCRLNEDFSVDINEYRLWFMPMSITEKPVSTVGLGDCFTSGYSLLAYP